MGYKENYKDTKDTHVLIPVGNEIVKCVKSWIASSQNGNPTWYMNFEIIVGKFKGEILKYTTSMGDKSKPYRKGNLTAMGFDTTNDIEYDLEDDVIDRICLATIYHDDFIGQSGDKITVSKIKMLRSAVESDFRLTSDDDVKGHLRSQARHSKDLAKEFENGVLSKDQSQLFDDM